MTTRKNNHSINRNGCPKGYILRKSYTRKYRPNVASSGFTVRRKGKLYTVRPKASSIHVPSGCIKNRGLSGKGPKEGEGIGKLRKGDLIKYGYQYRLSDKLREKALKKAITQYGPLGVYRKLNAISKLSVRTVPDASKVFSRDRNWVRSHYSIKNK
jgi:hypothetical protein